MASGEEDQIKIAMERCTGWYRRFVFWRLISWGLTAIIAGGSAFVASQLSEGHPREIMALVVATCASIQAALAPASKAAAFRQAWVILDLSLKEFVGLPSTLVQAIQNGENQIDQTHVVGQSPQIG